MCTDKMSVNGLSMKEEPQDEAEIQSLADKMVEANKARMVNASRTFVPPVNQPVQLLNFLTRNNGKSATTTTTTNNNNNNNKIDAVAATAAATTTNSGGSDVVNKHAVLDERSQKGQFGWTMLGKVHIPYIFRGEDKYCAVRMVEAKALNKYLRYLHPDIYNCTCIRSYYITEAEAQLLNQINFMHCDQQYGRDQFTARDLIVRVSDAFEFYKFLDSCYSKLLNGTSNPLDRCGFIRINKESVVPYTLCNEQKYVPLFYFEGETDNLKLKTHKLEGWDLCYLKFCCKVQGIRNQLFAHDSCSVISLNDIKNYFPPGTVFEDYWPNKMIDTQLLINGKTQTQMCQWTRQPAAPPAAASATATTSAASVVPVGHILSAPKPAAQAKAAVPSSNQLQQQQQHGVQAAMYANYAMAGAHATYPGPQTRSAAAAAMRSTYVSNAPAPRQARPPYYYNMA